MAEASVPLRVPKLLVELQPWHRVFFGNLRDLFFPRRLPPLVLTAPPGRFWPDVLINDRLPWTGLRFSGVGHAVVVGAIFALAYYGFFGTRPQTVRDPFHNTITYYSVADYLPEVNSGSKPSTVELKGEPAYAKQEIISVPKEPDNTRQTIVTPWEMKLKKDVRLPNIVAWNPNMPAAPISATPGRKITIPTQPEVVAPAPEAIDRAGAIRMPSELMKPATAVAPAVDPSVAPMRKLARVEPQVVGPAAEVAAIRRNLPTVPVPSVVAPAIEPDRTGRRPGAINMARVGPEVIAPSLPVAEQRALGVGQEAGGGHPATGSKATGNPTNAGPAQTAIAAAAPTTAGSGTRNGGGQLIALSVDPAEASGSIDIPMGTRRGIFAASPTGRIGAPGTPDIHKGGDGPGGTAKSGDSGTGSGTRSAPEGVYIGPGGTTSPAGAVAATKPSSGNAPGTPSFRDKLMAAARAPDIPRPPAAGSTTASDERKIDDQVFGPKKYYSLTLNMPNLSSSSGSWIIRFAELKESHDGFALSGPVPLNKVDPAYPAELLRDKVEGTVILYAVIHRDGSIGEIKVLKSVDERLDENAAKALARWHFKPGTKNGEPVDLEAVVQIPFRVKRLPF